MHIREVNSKKNPCSFFISQTEHIVLFWTTIFWTELFWAMHHLWIIKSIVRGSSVVINLCCINSKENKIPTYHVCLPKKSLWHWLPNFGGFQATNLVIDGQLSRFDFSFSNANTFITWFTNAPLYLFLLYREQIYTQVLT